MNQVSSLLSDSLLERFHSNPYKSPTILHDLSNNPAWKLRDVIESLYNDSPPNLQEHLKSRIVLHCGEVEGETLQRINSALNELFFFHFWKKFSDAAIEYEPPLINSKKKPDFKINSLDSTSHILEMWSPQMAFIDGIKNSERLEVEAALSEFNFGLYKSYLEYTETKSQKPLFMEPNDFVSRLTLHIDSLKLSEPHNSQFSFIYKNRHFRLNLFKSDSDILGLQGTMFSKDSDQLCKMFQNPVDDRNNKELGSYTIICASDSPDFNNHLSIRAWRDLLIGKIWSIDRSGPIDLDTQQNIPIQLIFFIVEMRKDLVRASACRFVHPKVEMADTFNQIPLLNNIDLDSNHELSWTTYDFELNQ